MPLVPGRKRRAEPEPAGSPKASPEPQAQRRRVSSTHRDMDRDSSFGGDGGAAAAAAAEDSGLDEMAKKLVRLALACEFSRKPIRRQDVGEKVLGPNSRAFKKVLERAQMHLRATFGMELTELPTREKMTVQQRRAAQKTDAQAVKHGTASWMLTSTLPSAFHHPSILQPPAAPTCKDEAEYTAVYTVLVSAVQLAGGQLSHDKMERYLARLRIDDQTPVAQCEKNEKLMRRMEREGYLAKVKESTGTGEDDVYWIVGPRGKVEVGSDGARGLALAVYHPPTDADEEHLERKIRRSLGLAEPAPRQNPEASRSRTRRGRGDRVDRRAASDEHQDEAPDSPIEHESEHE